MTCGTHPSSLPLHLIFSTLLPQSIDPARLLRLVRPPAPLAPVGAPPPAPPPPAGAPRPSSTTGEGGLDSGRPPDPCSDWPPHGQFCPAATVVLSRRRRHRFVSPLLSTGRSRRAGVRALPARVGRGGREQSAREVERGR
jgi:hypothetical protein